MKIGRMILAGMAATLTLSVAVAQQPATGTVTKIDRIHGTIAIQRTQSGTVGANAAVAAEEFKARDAALLNDVHAGDRITFFATEAGAVKTITKLEKN